MGPVEILLPPKSGVLDHTTTTPGRQERRRGLQPERTVWVSGVPRPVLPPPSSRPLPSMNVDTAPASGSGRHPTGVNTLRGEASGPTVPASLAAVQDPTTGGPSEARRGPTSDGPFARAVLSQLVTSISPDHTSLISTHTPVFGPYVASNVRFVNSFCRLRVEDCELVPVRFCSRP